MKRRNFLYSKATVIELFLVSFTIFISLYYIVPKYVIHQTEKSTVKKIKEYGGFVEYDNKGYVTEVNLVHGSDWRGNRIECKNKSDEILNVVPQFKKLKRLMIQETQATDHAMQYVGKVKSLEKLYMWSALVSDNGIEQLKGLSNLNYIHCSRSNITDLSLKTLSQFPSLTGMSLQANTFSDIGLSYLENMTSIEVLWVDISRGKITDEGVKHLVNLKNLKQLALQQTQITDRSIDYLKQLPNLERLILDNTSVSAEAIKKLESLLPKVKVTP